MTDTFARIDRLPATLLVVTCSSLTNHSPHFATRESHDFLIIPRVQQRPFLIHSTVGGRAEHSSLVCFSLLCFNAMAPKNKPSTPKKGGGGRQVKIRSRSQPPQQFQSDQELSRPDDDQPTLKDVIQTLPPLPLPMPRWIV